MRDVIYCCLVTVAVSMLMLLAEGIHTLRNYITFHSLHTCAHCMHYIHISHT